MDVSKNIEQSIVKKLVDGEKLVFVVQGKLMISSKFNNVKLHHCQVFGLNDFPWALNPEQVFGFAPNYVAWQIVDENNLRISVKTKEPSTLKAGDVWEGTVYMRKWEYEGKVGFSVYANN